MQLTWIEFVFCIIRRRPATSFHRWVYTPSKRCIDDRHSFPIHIHTCSLGIDEALSSLLAHISTSIRFSVECLTLNASFGKLPWPDHGFLELAEPTSRIEFWLTTGDGVTQLEGKHKPKVTKGKASYSWNGAPKNTMTMAATMIMMTVMTPSLHHSLDLPLSKPSTNHPSMSMLLAG